MHLHLNSELTQFERQYRNISAGFPIIIDLSVTCQCGLHWQ